MDEYKRLQTLGKVFGIESFLLSPEETQKLYPPLNVEDIFGSLFSPLDGAMEPEGVCKGMIKMAAEAGVKVKNRVLFKNPLLKGFIHETL